MPGRVEGKVAFITGAGRGQGRSHAIRLAEEGADIIAVDICQDYGTVAYGMSTEADLAETAKAVEALDRRIVAAKADVRDATGLKAAVDDGVWPSSGGWTLSAPTPASARSMRGTRSRRRCGRTRWTPT
jgi:NADP-dependent 3-hydroxy acid dehydrogenase YdfG